MGPECPTLYDATPKDYEVYTRNVLNETVDNKIKGIQKLKIFMEKENLKCLDENDLIMVLRCCKYNIKKAETKLKRYLKARRVISNGIAKVDMSTIKLQIDEMFFAILPYTDSNGSIIFFTQPHSHMADYYTDEIVFCFLAAILFCLTLPMPQLYGFSAIGDNATPSFPMYFPLIKICKKLLPYVLDLPFRIHKLEIIKENFWSRWLYNTLFRPFISTKIIQRIHFHGTSLESIHKNYHPDILPENIGGNLGTLTNKHYREQLLNFIEKLGTEYEHTKEK